jgi:hypothetical protein
MVYFINKETLNITYNFICFNKMNAQTKFKKSHNLKNGRRTVLTLQRGLRNRGGSRHSCAVDEYIAPPLDSRDQKQSCLSVQAIDDPFVQQMVCYEMHCLTLLYKRC